MFLRITNLKVVSLVAVLAAANQFTFAQPNSGNVLDNLTNAVQYAKGKGGSPIKSGGTGGGSTGGGTGGGELTQEELLQRVDLHFSLEVHPLVYPRCYQACHQSGGIGEVSGLIFVSDSESNQIDQNYTLFTDYIINNVGEQVLSTIANTDGSHNSGGSAVYAEGTDEHNKFVTLIDYMKEAGLL